MNRSNPLLYDLEAIARDGKSVYERAAEKVHDRGLKKLFTRIANIKAGISKSLTEEIEAMSDKPAQTGALAGEFSEIYDDLRALAGRKDYAYVAQLEESEDRLIRAYKAAISDREISPHAVAVLCRLAPHVRQCHGLMSACKQSLFQAA